MRKGNRMDALRRLAALALAMCLVFSVSGCSSLEQAVTETAFKTAPPEERPGETAAVPSETPAATAERDGQADRTDGEEALSPGTDSLHFVKAEFNAQDFDFDMYVECDSLETKGLLYAGEASPVSDGVFWLHSGRQTGELSTDLEDFPDGTLVAVSCPQTALLNEDGTVRFATDQIVLRLSDFEDGTAFMTLAEGETDPLDYARLLRLESRHDVIVDKDGHTLYDTAWNGEWDEEILASGNGKYVLIRRRVNSAGEKEALLGTIDARGNTVDAFRSYDEAENYGEFTLSQLTKICARPGELIWTENLYTYRDPVYLGDGWYHLEGGYPGLLYNPEQQRVRITFFDRFLTRSLDGWVLGQKGEGDWSVYTLDLETGEKAVVGRQSDVWPAAGLCFVENRLVNAKGETVFEPKGFPQYTRYRLGAFRDGIAVLSICYHDFSAQKAVVLTTAVDTDFRILFDPLPAYYWIEGLQDQYPFTDGSRIYYKNEDMESFWIDAEGKVLEPLPWIDPDELMFRFFEHGYFQKSGSLYKVS